MKMISDEYRKRSRLLCIVLLIGCLLIAGCTQTSKDPIVTGSDTTGDITDVSVNTEIAETDTDTESNMGEADPGDTSLVSFRQAMVETPQLFAVAYFGYSAQELTDVGSFIQNSAPVLCDDLPFLLNIPDERIIGASGELYCIVPADKNATVAVNQIDSSDNEYTKVVYRSESGVPILLFCNNSGFEPDTQITITNSDGTVAVWNPCIDGSYHAVPLLNDDGESLFLDFSHYDELSAEDPNALG